MIVALLMPTRGRAEQMSENVIHLAAQDYPPGIQLLIVLAVPEDDHQTISAAAAFAFGDTGGSVQIIYKGRPTDSTAVDGWNQAYTLAHVMGADWFILGADDIRFKDGWLSQALKAAEPFGAEVIGLNDGDHTDLNYYAPHYMVTREFTEDFIGGYMVPPVYKAWWFDREICEKARHEGLYMAAPLAMAEHDHPIWNKAPWDDTYQLGAKYHDEDKKTYKQRRKAGYPLDYRCKNLHYSGLTSSSYFPPAVIEPVTTLAGSIAAYAGTGPRKRLKNESKSN